MLKCNKIVSLLVIGALFVPALLSSQQALADETESGSVVSSTAATLSFQQTTESSSTESSKLPEQTLEAANQYQIVNGEGDEIANNTLTDDKGNTITFQYDLTKGLVEDTAEMVKKERDDFLVSHFLFYRVRSRC
jgi:hypothetical protein